MDNFPFSGVRNCLLLASSLGLMSHEMSGLMLSSTAQSHGMITWADMLCRTAARPFWPSLIKRVSFLAQVRLPRTFKRFCGLFVQLLQKLSIRATNGPDKLLKVSLASALCLPVCEICASLSRRTSQGFCRMKGVCSTSSHRPDHHC